MLADSVLGRLGPRSSLHLDRPGPSREISGLFRRRMTRDAWPRIPVARLRQMMKSWSGCLRCSSASHPTVASQGPRLPRCQVIETGPPDVLVVLTVEGCSLSGLSASVNKAVSACHLLARLGDQPVVATCVTSTCCSRQKPGTPTPAVVKCSGSALEWHGIGCFSEGDRLPGLRVELVFPVVCLRV